MSCTCQIVNKEGKSLQNNTCKRENIRSINQSNTYQAYSVKNMGNSFLIGLLVDQYDINIINNFMNFIIKTEHGNFFFSIVLVSRFLCVITQLK